MGRRHLTPVRHPRAAGRPRALGVAGVVGVLALLVLPAIAAAHPLGNFTINHYTELRIEPGRVLLDVVIDEAEIPAFQARQEFDVDGDGTVSDEEVEAGRGPACADIATSLRLTADGEPLPLVVAEAGLSFPLGAGGLSTLRIVCGLEAPLPTAIGSEPTRISFTDQTFLERLGWREIVARGSGVGLTAVEGEVRDASVSARLTDYPPEMIAIPLRDGPLVVDALAGGAALPVLDIPDAVPLAGSAPPSGPPPSGAPSESPVATSSSAPADSNGPSPSPVVGAVPGGVDGGDLPAIFRADLTPIVVLVSLLTAAGLGVVHALTPGHGKTLMAAYLVGTRGTARHALALGLSVSLSHTVGILVLAGLVVGAADVLPPDVVVRWAPVVAAVSIVGIGAWMLIGEARRRRAVVGPVHDHDHDHDDQAHDHAAAEQPGAHSHGGIRHSHLPPAGSAITWRSLFVLGLAGGLIPSTSALLILLGSIAAGRPAFGFVLVLAFGLGMAAVMGGIGLAMVVARARLDRLPAGGGLGRLREAVPLVAAVLVFGFGLYLTIQALAAAPTL
jgi:ABC-type nickel/cobalt efflux system permease component RcnA